MWSLGVVVGVVDIVVLAGAMEAGQRRRESGRLGWGGNDQKVG